MNGKVSDGSLRVTPVTPEPELSIVIPVFNEEAVILETEGRLRGLLETLGETWEVVFVDDGSRDRSLEILRELAHREPRYKVLAFSRNFGHQRAITAGIDYARGRAVVVMDADLQDPPEVVRTMVQRWREGHDVVYGVRKHRAGETRFKRWTASLFYRLLRRLTGVPIPVDTGDFRLMSRNVVLTLRALRETHRFVRGMVAWVGFRQCAVEYDRDARAAGETKYPLVKMLRLAMDGVTSFSIIPLRLATWLGVLAFCGATAVGTWALWIRLFTVRAVPGWTTIMVLVTAGFAVQFLLIGILGEYVGRIFEEVKRRPLYVVAETIDVEAAAQGNARPLGVSAVDARVVAGSG